MAVYESKRISMGLCLAVLLLSCSFEKSHAQHWLKWWKPAGAAGKRMFNGLADVGEFGEDYNMAQNENGDLENSEMDPAYVQAYLTALLLSREMDDPSRGPKQIQPLLKRIMARKEFYNKA